MRHIQGISRAQMRFSSLEDAIAADNQVRFIDAFAAFLGLKNLVLQLLLLNQKVDNIKVFLKIYLYSYLNGLRSSRKLEKECYRNIEMQWLLVDIRPNYHSISDFRKNNPLALKNLFTLFVVFLKDADLIGCQTIARDGTKRRGLDHRWKGGSRLCLSCLRAPGLLPLQPAQRPFQSVLSGAI